MTTTPAYLRGLTRAAIKPHRMFSTLYMAAADGRSYVVEGVAGGRFRVFSVAEAQAAADVAGRVLVRVG